MTAWPTKNIYFIRFEFEHFFEFYTNKLLLIRLFFTFLDGTVLRKHCDIRVIPRAKIKTLKMSLSIVISFLVCWSPYFVVYNILIFSDYNAEIPDSVMMLVETLALLNSVMNPIIYSFFNLRIKQGLREICCFHINVQSEYAFFSLLL